MRKVDRELPTLPAELKGKCRSKFYPLAELFRVLSIHLSKVPLYFKFQQERGCKKAASRVFLLDLSVVPSHGGIHEQSRLIIVDLQRPWSRPQILLMCSFTSKHRGWGIFVIAILTIARFTSFREVTNLNFLPMSLMISSRP